MKYVSIPKTIEAIQYTRNNKEVEEFLGENCINIITERCINGKSWVEIKTLDSIGKAFDGDYICKGIMGEFYPCEKSIFEKSYNLLID